MGWRTVAAWENAHHANVRPLVRHPWLPVAVRDDGPISISGGEGRVGGIEPWCVVLMRSAFMRFVHVAVFEVACAGTTVSLRPRERGGPGLAGF